MKKTHDIRKDYIKIVFVMGEKRCNHCFKSESNCMMWAVNRYNDKGSYDTWYYSKECLQDKDEVLTELSLDSYPFGIFPVEPLSKKVSDDITWMKGETDRNLSMIDDFDYTPNVNCIKTKKRVFGK